MNKLLSILLICSIGFVQELEVDGDLKVTGNIQAGTIDSLQQIIIDLQLQILLMQDQITLLNYSMGITDCAGIVGGDSIVDLCGECNGNNSSCSLLSDVNGNNYTFIQIGNQMWMNENLKVFHFNDGDIIDDDDSSTLHESYVYNEDTEEFNVYGVLYNWHTINDDRGLCPEGSHVPSFAEWIELNTFLGSNVSHKLREVGSEHWVSSNAGATNESGFTALPGGYRHFSTGNYEGLNTGAWFWTSSAASSGYSHSIKLNSTDPNIAIPEFQPEYGFSVRCVGGE